MEIAAEVGGIGVGTWLGHGQWIWRLVIVMVVFVDRQLLNKVCCKNGLSPPEPAAHGKARIDSSFWFYFFFCLRGGVLGPPELMPP
jgi:hypothetical protein